MTTITDAVSGSDTSYDDYDTRSTTEQDKEEDRKTNSVAKESFRTMHCCSASSGFDRDIEGRIQGGLSLEWGGKDEPKISYSFDFDVKDRNGRHVDFDYSFDNDGRSKLDIKGGIESQGYLNGRDD